MLHQTLFIRTKSKYYNIKIPDAQLSADEMFDNDSFSESIINALPSGL